MAKRDRVITDYQKNELTVRGLLRPNNVDVAYDVLLAGRKIDVAIVTERFAHRLRVFSLPDMITARSDCFLP